jgi:hypothetical protein
METEDPAASDRRLAALLGVGALIALALTGAQAVLAQPSSPPSSTQAPPGPTPPMAPTPPEKIAPPATLAPSPSTGSGVIHPPGGVDPGIQSTAPAPTPNSMRVIPPPGTPGGNPNVQPK